MKRIVLTGGGTAGHVTPNLAILPLLRQEGWEVLYIGSENGIEKKLIEAEGVPYYSCLLYTSHMVFVKIFGSVCDGGGM